MFFTSFFLLVVRYNVIRDVSISLGWKEKTDEEYLDYWAVRGWCNTLEKANFKADVVFFGNSITYGIPFSDSIYNKKVVIMGYPGDKISKMHWRVSQIDAVSPKYVFIMAGINDLNDNRVSLEEFKCTYYNLLDTILNRNNGAEIFIESILPVNHTLREDCASSDRICKANKILKKLAKDRNIEYVDLYAKYVDEYGELPENITRDGIHLRIESYNIWLKEILNYIK